MKKQPKALILTGNGFNTQQNLSLGFTLCGAKADLVPLQQFLRTPQMLLNYHILGIPGGFSYGDRISAGRIAAHLIRKRAHTIIRDFLSHKGLILGTCNGFQVLLKMNLLPFPQQPTQQATLTFNKNFLYENTWTPLQCNPQSPCIWTKGLTFLSLPYLAREARLLIRETHLQTMVIQRQLNAISYATQDETGNCINGSFHNIAGLCDESGQILGVLSHPEFILRDHHSLNWKNSPQITDRDPDGLSIFRNGVQFVQQCLS